MFIIIFIIIHVLLKNKVNARVYHHLHHHTRAIEKQGKYTCLSSSSSSSRVVLNEAKNQLIGASTHTHKHTHKHTHIHIHTHTHTHTHTYTHHLFECVFVFLDCPPGQTRTCPKCWMTRCPSDLSARCR